MVRPYLLLLVLLFLAGGCATVAGILAGPIAYPISSLRHSEDSPWYAQACALPINIFLGPLYGFQFGIITDISYVQNGEYGGENGIPFKAVFDPLGIIYSEYDARVSTIEPVGTMSRDADSKDAGGSG